MENLDFFIKGIGSKTPSFEDGFNFLSSFLKLREIPVSVVDYNSQGSTRNALVKQEMRHTFRRKAGDKEQRKLAIQQGLNQVSKPEKKQQFPFC